MREMDGTSLIGPVSVAQPQANYIQEALDISWKVLDPKGNVKIWVAATNNFKEGKPDDYQLVAEMPVTNGHTQVSVKKHAVCIL